VLTSLLRYLDTPVFGAVVGSLVAPSRAPLLRRLVPNHSTSLAFRDAFHTSILLPPSRLLRRWNLPHQTMNRHMAACVTGGHLGRKNAAAIQRFFFVEPSPASG